MAETVIWLRNMSSLLELTRTADFSPVKAWMSDPETGKRRPSSKQAMTEEGLPIWEIKLIGVQDVYGRPEDAFLTLRVASRNKPDRSSLSKVAVID